jgi:hypothetical protein
MNDIVKENIYGVVRSVAGLSDDGGSSLIAARHEPPIVTASMISYGDVIFHHLPNFYAPSALVAMLVHAVGLGLILNDLLSNFSFDKRLLCSPGWSNPLKALNRLAYFLLRFGTAIDLILVLIYSNVEGLPCTPYFRAIKSAWYLSILCVDFIFVTRTLALYGWPKKLYIPIGLLTLTYASLGMYNTWAWGYSVEVPASNFCAYISQDPRDEPIKTIFPVYYGVAIFTDTIILILTCMRLATLPQRTRGSSNSMELQNPHTLKRLPTLSSTLLVQGFVLYGAMEGTRLAIILVFYLADYRQSWTLMVLGIAVTIKALTASVLVRQTSNVARQRQTHYSSTNLINSGVCGAGVPPLSPMGFTCATCNVNKLIERAQKDLERRRARPDLAIRIDEKVIVSDEALISGMTVPSTGKSSSQASETRYVSRLGVQPSNLLYNDRPSTSSHRQSAESMVLMRDCL